MSYYVKKHKLIVRISICKKVRKILVQMSDEIDDNFLSIKIISGDFPLLFHRATNKLIMQEEFSNKRAMSKFVSRGIFSYKSRCNKQVNICNNRSLSQGQN